MKTINAVAFISLAIVQMGLSQSFINLDFESATIVPDPASPYYPYGIAISNALPGWAVFGSTQGDITYNAPSVGSTSVMLIATNGGQISGSYSIQLEGMLSFFPATINQTGLVPFGTESLLFEAQSFLGSTSLVVSLGAQALSFSAVGIGSNYTLYGANISAFAGQVENLMFSAASTGQNIWNIDNIQFSSSPVPEPSAFYLSALGGLFFAGRCTSWKKSSAN